MIQAAKQFKAEFFKMESAGGILLMVAAIFAMICANTPMSHYYNLILETPVVLSVGELVINKPLLLWINDGLMTVFFFVVGLELKRELLEGELSDKSNIVMPAAGAVGGMLFPALCYSYFNYHDPEAMKGWAIPAATDIAFALGVLALLGSRVPISIKIFLTSLAIFDDIGAIIIIAVFYTANISLTALSIAAVCVLALAILNFRHVDTKSSYLVVGVIMWIATLKSGVHATLAGVVLAMFIPMYAKSNPEVSPVKNLEYDLHSAVAFFILPVFAFANAGVGLAGIGFDQFFHSVPLGIAVGLVVGKQVGVFGFCWLVIKLGWTRLPKGMSWLSLYGTAALCGIGFTMSLFIGSLAFENAGSDLLFDERLGIIIGSLISGTFGYFVLRKSLSANSESAADKESSSA